MLTSIRGTYTYYVCLSYRLLSTFGYCQYSLPGISLYINHSVVMFRMGTWCLRPSMSCSVRHWASGRVGHSRMLRLPSHYSTCLQKPYRSVHFVIHRMIFINDTAIKQNFIHQNLLSLKISLKLVYTHKDIHSVMT